MPLPYSFISGDIARSAQVNANFDYIMDMLGQVSTPDRVQPLGEFLMGPRKLALISASHDTGSYFNKFIQISWNADWNKEGSNWKFSRIVNNDNGSALRVGTLGLEFLTTSATTGNLHAQMKRVWALTATSGEDYMYLADDWHIRNEATQHHKLQTYRLTTVFLENPAAIYANVRVSKGIKIYKASDFGIPRHAKAIIINAHVTAANHSGAGMLFYQHRNNAGTGSNRYRGMVVHAAISGGGLGMRAGAQGSVPLGDGPFASEFVVERTSEFALANVYIVGYMT